MADNEEPSNKRQEMAMSSSSPSWERLPDDLWHYIFTHLAIGHHRSLGSVSLVCRRFLALSNRTLTFFSIDPRFKPVPLPTLFSRFSNISSIRLSFDHHLDASLTLLANSGLPLQSLHLFDQPHFPKDAMRLLGDRMTKTLKSLSCIWFKNINDDDLAVVAACFPYLHQFDVQETDDNLSYFTDSGISEISAKLKSLGYCVVLCGFFKSCRSLGHLRLTTFSFPADTNAIEFAASLPNIRLIGLQEMSITMPPATLLYLLKDCRLLEEIHTACSFLGINRDWFNNTSTKSVVRKLDLYNCNDLCDETLKLLVSVCPKLEALWLMRSSNITRKGVEAVAASCNNIKYLYAGLCDNVQDFELDRRGQVLE